MDQAEKIIDGILRREGGFVFHPADKGLATNKGITQAAWSEYIGRQATVADMGAITDEMARQFYRHEHVIRPGFHRIRDPHLRALVIDAGVNHGPRHAAKWLQWAASDETRGIRLKQDGIVGDRTIAAVDAADPLELILWITAFRVKLYGRLIAQDPELRRAREAKFRLQAEFAGGWTARAAEFLESAAVRLEILHNATR